MTIYDCNSRVKLRTLNHPLVYGGNGEPYPFRDLPVEWPVSLDNTENGVISSKPSYIIGRSSKKESKKFRAEGPTSTYFDDVAISANHLLLYLSPNENLNARDQNAFAIYARDVSQHGALFIRSGQRLTERFEYDRYYEIRCGDIIGLVITSEDKVAGDWNIFKDTKLQLQVLSDHVGNLFLARMNTALLSEVVDSDFMVDYTKCVEKGISCYDNAWSYFSVSRYPLPTRPPYKLDDRDPYDSSTPSYAEKQYKHLVEHIQDFCFSCAFYDDQKPVRDLAILNQDVLSAHGEYEDELELESCEQSTIEEEIFNPSCYDDSDYEHCVVETQSCCFGDDSDSTCCYSSDSSLIVSDGLGEVDQQVSSSDQSSDDWLDGDSSSEEALGCDVSNHRVFAIAESESEAESDDNGLLSHKLSGVIDSFDSDSFSDDSGPEEVEIVKETYPAKRKWTEEFEVDSASLPSNKRSHLSHTTRDLKEQDKLNINSDKRSFATGLAVGSVLTFGLLSALGAYIQV